MQYFARIENGIVCEVIVIDSANCGDFDFPESEAIGQAFISGIGLTGDWKQTSDENNYRGTYACTGFTYNLDLDVFLPPTTDKVTE
jgi:hypothetical protein